MTVYKVTDAPNIVLREDYVGCATTAICYPGVSSCITITCVSPSGLLGAHITVRTTPVEIAEMFQFIRANMSGIYAYYVVGSIRNYKDHTTNEEINERTKLQKRLKKEFNPQGLVGFFDTTPYTDVHVFAEKNGLKTTFYWIAAAGNNVAGMNYPAPAFAGRTMINDSQFETL